MNIVKNIKIYILLFSIILLGIVILSGWYYEMNSCMGISLMSTGELDAYTEDLDVDITDIKFNGERIAADLIRDRIYISQSPDLLSHYSELQGKLTIENSKQKLYLLNNLELKNLKETISNGEYLTLIVVDGKSFCSIPVAVSTLPVLSLEGRENGEVTEKGQFVYNGDVTVFAGMDPCAGNMTVENYFVEWHVRGGNSAKLSKKPQKLSLKKRNGDNLNADLLGMGADDDWILNPMNMDDTRLREKAALDLWNEYIIKDQPSNYPMTTSQYVEVILNGEYQGLYLLQRRVDEKYLQIDKKRDILFKGRQTWVANNAYEGYEIVYSPYDDIQTYAILDESLYTIDEENYIDVNLFIDFLSATDNVGYKNMFYLLKEEADGAYIMYHIPWDTDISMGIIPSGGFINIYDYDLAMPQNSRRMDYYNILLEHSDLDGKMAERWKELSGTMFGESGIFEQILEANKQYILDSGAFTRDNKHWGFIYGGRDTMDNLFKWNVDKTALMDEYYK